jgi:hypothetical protein
MRKLGRASGLWLLLIALSSLGLSAYPVLAVGKEDSLEGNRPVAYSEAQTKPELAVFGEFGSDDFSDDPTAEELRDELGNFGYDSEDLPLDLRITDYDSAASVGKLIIKVHKSSTKDKLEYLEVFTQNSEDGEDLTPMNLFAGENKALVSTAGTYGRKTYSTPSGIFRIDLMERMHYSSKYGNAPMPWSVFFNGGIAIHGATPDEFKHLGRKASHGCVRVHPQNAKLIYAAIQASASGAIIMVLDS